jgi:Ca-activated chloride channel family protein
MNNQAEKNLYNKYVELRKDYINSPTFYYDMANFFFRKNDKATGLKILSNIAELNIEDHELFAMLGYKLKEAGFYTEALYVFKKVLQWRPHEPQSYRHYALALQDLEKWQEAADTLYAGLTKKYDDNIIEDYEGIADAMLMELNDIIALHRPQIKTTKYNKKIIGALPVDIRVVLNWNRDNTDIDLWLTDPKGEKCFFGNSQTAGGALISNDMTNGYGPEQLMVKKAIKGKYKIQIHYYGDSQMKLTGPSTVLAEVFTRYSTGNEQRKLITMQMESNEDKDGILVGEFSFE